MTRTSPLKIGDAYFVSEACKLPRSLRRPKRRPRSARYIGTVTWCWAPCHDRADDIYISLDSSRKYFLLWLEWTGEFRDCILTAFLPTTGKLTPAIACELVTASYTGGERHYAEGTGRWQEVHEGLLRKSDFEVIADRVWPAPPVTVAPAPRPDYSTPEARATLALGPILDTFAIAESVLRREALRAVSATAVNIGGVFFQAANALENLGAVLTARARTSPLLIPASIEEVRRTLSIVESRLPHVPDRFAELWKAIEALCIALDVQLQEGR